MRAAILLVAMSAVMTAWLPAAANAECEPFNRKYLEVQALEARLGRETARVTAMKPLPKTDDVLCDAAYAFMTHANFLWRMPEPTCFQNKAQMDDFAARLHKAAEGAWQLMQVSCSDAKMGRR